MLPAYDNNELITLKKSCESGVTKGNVASFALRQSINNISQLQQRRIDVLRFTPGNWSVEVWIENILHVFPVTIRSFYAIFLAYSLAHVLS